MRRANEELLCVDHDEAFSVSRERSESERYFLDVLCGGIGVFERRLEMTPEEVAVFLRNPKELALLASQVRKWPERFGQRCSCR